MDEKEKMERITGEPQPENKEERSLAMQLLIELKSTVKRLWIIILILIAVLVGTNMAWLYVFQSYDYTSTVTVEGKDAPAFYQEGKDNTINNGTNSQDENQN